MATNPILEEIYTAREKLLADAGGDVHKYLEGVRAREAASGRLLPHAAQRTERGETTLDTHNAGLGNPLAPAVDR